MNDKNGKLTYNVEEACGLIGTNRTAIYAAVAKGDLHSFKMGKRRFFTAAALKGWIAKMEIMAKGKAA